MERCPYCFKPLPENGECDCHYAESENSRIAEALEPGTVLGACYQVGAVLGKGGFGIYLPVIFVYGYPGSSFGES